VRSDEWPAWFCFWFSGRWRALAKGTAWAGFYCAIHHHHSMASSKGRIESEPRGPSQLRGMRRAARIAPSQLRIATIRHGLKVFVIIFILPCFGHHFGWPFPSQD